MSPLRPPGVVSTVMPNVVSTVLPELVSDPRLARAAWSRIAEPGDPTAAESVTRLGPGPALAEAVLGAGADSRRFRARVAALDPRPGLDLLDRRGGRLVCPGDPGWPPGLDQLEAPPFCLWVIGPLDLAQAAERSVSIVGARAATPYGADVTDLLAEGCSRRGFTIVSGAALGIDGWAHRAALATGGPTVAVLAGGVDRAYPPAHADLLRQIGASGAVLSEVPPGSAPTRNRFIQRNRMIATMTRGTVVVEAAVRSGALNTARTAAHYGLPVGVVPGPVTSPMSAGCHQALRDGYAVAVTDSAEVVDLVGRIGDDLAVRPSGPTRADWDEVDPVARRVLEALPKGQVRPDAKIAAVAGLDLEATRSALGRLALAELAERRPGGWRRARPGPGSPARL